MKNSIATLIVAGVAMFGMGAAFATEPAPQSAVEIRAELKKLQKAVGAGEISSKAYNTRKRELTAALEGQTQQVGEAKK